MKRRWNTMSFLSGLLFAIGLAVAGMTDPEKVKAFLDITGDWDPTLAFVMGGAIVVYAPAYRIITGRKHPLLGEGFFLPRRNEIDAKLVLGAVAFGIGWGAVGFCPGPALVAMATLRETVLIFGLSMVIGMALFKYWESRSD